MQASYGAPLRGSCGSASSHMRTAAATSSSSHSYHSPLQLAQGRRRCTAMRRVARLHPGGTAGTAARAQPGGSSYDAPTSSGTRDASSASADDDDTVTIATAAATAEAAPGAPPFDWLRAWYAVGMVDALAPDVPTALRVVGVPLALWRDAGGDWRALRDECPHRLAPLSEGRVAEDGTLQARAWAARGAAVAIVGGACY
jgi:hypothetical protein